MWWVEEGRRADGFPSVLLLLAVKQQQGEDKETRLDDEARFLKMAVSKELEEQESSREQLSTHVSRRVDSSDYLSLLPPLTTSKTNE